MRPALNRLLVVATLSVAVAPCALPQGTASSARADSSAGVPTLWFHAPQAYGAWVAGAHHSEFRTRTGVAGHRDFFLLGVRLGWPLPGGDEPGRVVKGMYFVDLFPLAVSTGMPEYTWNRTCRPGFICPGATPIEHTVYAYGLAPIGWSVSIGNERTRLHLEASGGGLWFSRPIPDPEATRFNFTASAGPALELAVAPSGKMRVGYLWHHTSNGGRGRVNPGLNSGILSVGLLYQLKRAVR